MQILGLAGRVVTYTLRLPSIAQDLDREMGELLGAKADLLAEIDHGGLNNRKRTRRAEFWLEEVNKVQSSAREFQNSLRQMNCFSVGSYYRLGCDVHDLLNAARRLNLERKDLTVLREAMPDPVVPLPSSSHAIVGTKSALSDIHRFLEDDDSKIIGIYGMGGVGKTTLMKAINNDLLLTTSSRFDIVIFITVSKDYGVFLIQEQIGKRLGLSRDTDSELPVEPYLRSQKLCSVLRKKKFLLLLDDLWEKLDLGEVGIPVSPLSRSGSKIVFTTRSIKVCNDMGAAQWKVKVHPLSPDKSWELFCNTLGKREDDWTQTAQHLARKVANKCGGLPLALITVGRAMADATTDGEWEEALMTLRGTAAELGDMKEVLKLLKFSFDRIKDETHKACLLYCSLFPEDRDIDTDLLIEYWMAEGFLEREGFPCSFNRVRNRGLAVISALKAACLLEDGYHPGLLVKLHDVIREMALWITSGDCETEKTVFLVNSGERLEHVPMPERWTNATRISLVNNLISQLPEMPSCKNMKTLLLKGNPPLREINSSFFLSMPTLTVLDLSNTGIQLLPPEISSLVELQLLDVSKSMLKLLPKELGKLTKLRRLNLDGTSSLERIPKEAISLLSCLQSLNVFRSAYGLYSKGGCPKGEVCFKDLEGLKQLDELGLTIKVSSKKDLQVIMDSDRLSKSIIFLSLVGRGCSSPLKLSEFLEAVKNLKKLVIEDLSEMNQLIFPANQLEQLDYLRLNQISAKTISWFNGSVPLRGSLKCFSFKNLIRIEIFKCEALEEISWVRAIPCLEDLWVSKCTKMVEIIKDEESSMTSMKGEEDSLFPNLKRITLFTMQNLERIYKQPLLFPELMVFSVTDCPMLKKLPFGICSAKNIRRILSSSTWLNELEWDHVDIRSKFTPFFVTNGQTIPNSSW